MGNFKVVFCYIILIYNRFLALEVSHFEKLNKKTLKYIYNKFIIFYYDSCF